MSAAAAVLLLVLHVMLHHALISFFDACESLDVVAG
jgi:hypothetical protein